MILIAKYRQSAGLCFKPAYTNMRDVFQKQQRFEFFSVYSLFLANTYFLNNCCVMLKKIHNRISWHGRNTLCHKQLWYNIFLMTV
jgi:hypothetical protein